jgi:hypothetical protein
MEKQDWVRGLILLLVTTAICSILAIYAVIKFPAGSAQTGVSALYIVAAIYIPFALWFGAWGAGAAYLSCLVLGLYLQFPLGGTLVWSFADLIEAVIPLLAFRLLKKSEELRAKRDWALYVIFGVFLSSLLSAIWGTSFDPSTPFSWQYFASWFFGDLIVIAIITTILLFFVTPLINKTRFYVHGYLK